MNISSKCLLSLLHSNHGSRNLRNKRSRCHRHCCSMDLLPLLRRSRIFCSRIFRRRRCSRSQIVLPPVLQLLHLLHHRLALQLRLLANRHREKPLRQKSTRNRARKASEAQGVASLRRRNATACISVRRCSTMRIFPMAARSARAVERCQSCGSTADAAFTCLVRAFLAGCSCWFCPLFCRLLGAIFQFNRSRIVFACFAASELEGKLQLPTWQAQRGFMSGLKFGERVCKGATFRFQNLSVLCKLIIARLCLILLLALDSYCICAILLLSIARVAVHVFQEKLWPKVTFLFESEGDAQAARQWLGLAGEPTAESFRWCTYHKGIHHIQAFMVGFRLNRRESWRFPTDCE
mgnify:CR=1 FL=1